MKKDFPNMLKAMFAPGRWRRLFCSFRSKRMTVVDHEPWTWILVADGKRLLLDVACNHSFAGYNWLIALRDHEFERYESEGRDYLTELAGQVQYSAPILKGTTSPFRDRKLGKWQEEAVHDAVMKWRASGAV